MHPTAERAHPVRSSSPPPPASLFRAPTVVSFPPQPQLLSSALRLHAFPLPAAPPQQPQRRVNKTARPLLPPSITRLRMSFDLNLLARAFFTLDDLVWNSK